MVLHTLAHTRPPAGRVLFAMHLKVHAGYIWSIMLYVIVGAEYIRVQPRHN